MGGRRFKPRIVSVFSTRLRVQVVVPDVPCADIYVFRDAFPDIPTLDSAALVFVDHEAGLTTFRGAVPLDRALAKPNVVYLGTSQPTARPFPGKVIPSPANCHSRA